MKLRLPAAPVVALTLIAMLLPVSSASASGTQETFVTMISSGGDYIGAGVNRVYQPGNASIGLSGSPAYVTVSVSGGNQGDDFSLDFAAPPGETLHVGSYERAQRASFRESGRPGIDISGDGRGCNTDSGRFDVKEISTVGSTVTSLWIVYEQHCEGGIPFLIGEVRYNITGDGGIASVGPRNLRWPDADPNQPMGVASVWVTNPTPGPVTLESSSLEGSEDFIVREDGCAGKTLLQNSMCEVLVRYRPTSPGDKTATLTIPEMGGVAHTTTFTGHVRDGVTRFLMFSEKGDYVGGGQDWGYDSSNASINVNGSRKEVHGWLDGANGDWWSFDFTAPDGDVLVAGSTYENAHRYPFNGTGAGIDVSGDGRGCNEETGEFTITQLIFDEYGDLERLGLYFEQHCENGTPALYGIVDYRAKPPTTGPDRTLQVAKNGAGTGSVTSSPAGVDCGGDCSETYSFGKRVELQASPQPGSRFSGWSGACQGTSTCVLKMGRDKDVTATFEENSPEPSVSTIHLHDKTDTEILVGGDVDPNHAGKKVTLTLARKKAGVYKVIVRREITLSAKSKFASRFDRPKAGDCRARVVFPGDHDHAASRDSIRFTC
jgi:hypothetical protein